jgi:hypothetical protein
MMCTPAGQQQGAAELDDHGEQDQAVRRGTGQMGRAHGHRDPGEDHDDAQQQHPHAGQEPPALLGNRLSGACQLPFRHVNHLQN